MLLILDDYGVVDETEHTGRHVGDDGSPDEGMSLCDGQSTAVWDCAVPGFMVCSRVCFFRRLSGAKSREINAEMQAKTPKLHFRHFRNTL